MLLSQATTLLSQQMNFQILSSSETGVTLSYNGIQFHIYLNPQGQVVVEGDEFYLHISLEEIRQRFENYYNLAGVRNALKEFGYDIQRFETDTEGRVVMEAQK